MRVIALLSLFVAILTFITPEIRCLLGLDDNKCFSDSLRQEGDKNRESIENENSFIRIGSIKNIKETDRCFSLYGNPKCLYSIIKIKEGLDNYLIYKTINEEIIHDDRELFDPMGRKLYILTSDKFKQISNLNKNREGENILMDFVQ